MKKLEFIINVNKNKKSKLIIPKIIEKRKNINDWFDVRDSGLQLFGFIDSIIELLGSVSNRS